MKKLSKGDRVTYGAETMFGGRTFRDLPGTVTAEEDANGIVGVQLDEVIVLPGRYELLAYDYVASFTPIED